MLSGFDCGTYGPGKSKSVFNIGLTKLVHLTNRKLDKTEEDKAGVRQFYFIVSTK